eukprot:6183986-Pleurochrysis_carterae.AAC.3
MRREMSREEEGHSAKHKLRAQKEDELDDAGSAISRHAGKCAASRETSIALLMWVSYLFRPGVMSVCMLREAQRRAR